MERAKRCERGMGVVLNHDCHDFEMIAMMMPYLPIPSGWAFRPLKRRLPPE